MCKKWHENKLLTVVPQLQHQLWERTFFPHCIVLIKVIAGFSDADHNLPMLDVSSDVVPPGSCGKVVFASLILIQAFLSR